MEHPSARSASRLSSVLEASLSGVLVFEPIPDASGAPADYRAIFANRAAGELIGTPAEQVAGNSLGNLFPNDAVLRVHFDRVVNRGEAQRFEFDHPNPTRALPGRTWFDASANRLDGAVVMSFLDVTATRQVQTQAEKTIGRLHSILDGSPAAIGLLEAVRDDQNRVRDFTIVSLNEQFCSLMKYEAADLIGRRFRKLFKRSLTAKLYDRFVRVVQTGVPLHEELHFERGPLQGWFDLTAVRQGDGLTITVLDVTAYREAEEKARQSARMLETVLDRAQSGVTWHRAVRNAGGEIEDFQVVTINDASAELFAKINPALRGQALEGWRLSSLFPQAWDLGLFERFVKVVETGEPVCYERTYPSAEGELWYDVSAVKEDDGLILTFVDITRSKEAELEAEATAELLGGVFDASPWSIVFLAPEYDEDGDVVDFTFQIANAQSEVIGQRPLPDLLGGRLLEMYPRTREIGLFEEYVRVLETGKPFHREVFYDGEGIARWSHLVAVRQGEGLVLTNSDITDRKRAEGQNQESLRLLQGLLENSPVAIAWLEAVRDEAGTLVDFAYTLFNAQTLRVGQTFAQQLLRRRFRDLFPVGEPGSLFERFARVVETGRHEQADVRFGTDGGWFTVLIGKHDDGVVVQALDISERKRAEEKASESQKLVRDVIAAPNLGLAVYKALRDEEGTIVDFVHEFINQRTLDALDQDMTGRLLTDHGPDGVEQLPRFIEVIETGTPNGYLRHAEFGGSEHWILFSNAPIGNDRLVHRWEDVTELKQTERELIRVKDELAQRATDQYRTLFNSIGQGFCVLEMIFNAENQPVDYRFTDVNPAYEKQTGLTNVTGRTIREVQPNIDPAWVEQYGHVALTGEPFRSEAFVLTLGRWFEVHAFRTGPPEDQGVAVLFDDITERKRHEANLAFLAETSADFAPLFTAEEIMQRVGGRLAGHLHLSRCVFSTVDEDADRIEVIYDWRHDERLPALTGVHRITGNLTDLGREQYHAGKLNILHEIAANPLMNASADALRGIGFGSLVDVPHVQGGRWKFLLTVGRAEAGEWRADELELIRELASRIYLRIERARAEEALRESEQRLRRMVNVPQVGVLTFDFSGTMLDANDTFLEMIGLSRAAFEARRFSGEDFTPPEYVEAGQLQLQNIVATEQGGPYEKEYLRKDGSRVWLMFVAADLGDGTIVEYAIDISDRKEAEEALRQSGERLRLVLESTKDYAIFTLDLGRCVTSWSTGAQNLMGYAEANIVGQLGDIIFTPEDRAADAPGEEAEKAIRTGRAENERWHLRQDGSRFWGSGLTHPLRDEGGRVIGFVKVMRDLTEQKRAEAALREAEEKYRTHLEREVAERTAELKESRDLLQSVLDATADGVVALRALRQETDIRDFEYLLVNRRAERLLNEQDLTGKRLLEVFVNHREAGLFKNYARVVETGRPWEAELLYSGKLVQTWMAVSVVKFGDGCVVTLNDITVRKKAEQDLRRNKELLQSVFEATPNGIGVLKSIRGNDYGPVDFEYVLTNQAARETVGGASLVGERYTVAHNQSELSALFWAMREVAQSGNRQRLEVHNQVRGEDRWYDATVVSFEDGVVMSVNDTTTPSQRSPGHRPRGQFRVEPGRRSHRLV